MQQACCKLAADMPQVCHCFTCRPAAVNENFCKGARHLSIFVYSTTTWLTTDLATQVCGGKFKLISHQISIPQLEPWKMFVRYLLIYPRIREFLYKGCHYREIPLYTRFPIIEGLFNNINHAVNGPTKSSIFHHIHFIQFLSYTSFTTSFCLWNGFSLN